MEPICLSLPRCDRRTSWQWLPQFSFLLSPSRLFEVLFLSFICHWYALGHVYLCVPINDLTIIVAPIVVDNWTPL